MSVRHRVGSKPQGYMCQVHVTVCRAGIAVLLVIQTNANCGAEVQASVYFHSSPFSSISRSVAYRLC